MFQKFGLTLYAIRHLLSLQKKQTWQSFFYAMVSKVPYKNFTGNSTQWSLDSCPGKNIPFFRTFQKNQDILHSYFWFKCSDGQYYRIFTNTEGVDEIESYPHGYGPQDYFEEIIHERTFGLVSLDTMKGIIPQNFSPYDMDYIYETNMTIEELLNQLIDRCNDREITALSFTESLFKNKIHTKMDSICAFPFSELDSTGWKTPTWLAKREKLMKKFKIHDPPSIWANTVNPDVVSRILQVHGDQRWIHDTAWIHALLNPVTVTFTHFDNLQNCSFIVLSTAAEAARVLPKLVHFIDSSLISTTVCSSIGIFGVQSAHKLPASECY